MKSPAVRSDGRSSGRVAAMIAMNGGATNSPHADRTAAYTQTGVMSGNRPSSATMNGSRSAVSRSSTVPAAAKTTTDATRTAVADSARATSSVTPAASSGSVATYAAAGAYTASAPAASTQNGSAMLHTSTGWRGACTRSGRSAPAREIAHAAVTPSATSISSIQYGRAYHGW